MKIKESITIAIPAFNEEETLERVVLEALSTLKSLTKDYELLLVNDGSTDNTGEIMSKLKRKNKHIKIINHKQNMGFTGAISTSLLNGSKDLIILAPADGQFNFHQMERFIRGIKDYDVVVGYRTKNAESFIRKVQSLVFHMLGKILLGINLKGYAQISLWRKHVLRDMIVISHPRSNNALVEIVARSLNKGYRFKEVPITWRKRRGGKPKGIINPAVIFYTTREMIRIRRSIRHGKIF